MRSSKCVVDEKKILFFLNDGDLIESGYSELNPSGLKLDHTLCVDSNTTLSSQISITLNGAQVTLSLEGKVVRREDGETYVEFVRPTPELEDHIGNIIELEKACA